MQGRWRMGRIAGLVAVLVLGGGLGGLAGPGTASAAACAAGTQPAGPVRATGSDDLRGVAVVGACDVWAVGFEVTQDTGVHTLIEHWTGGSNWAVIPSPDPAVGSPSDPGGAVNQLLGVAAASATSIWAVGQYVGSGDTDIHGMVEHWDGANWTQVSLPVSGEALSGVTAISANDVWVAGDSAGSAILLHYDGSGWTRWLAPPLTPGPGEGSTQRIHMTGMTATSPSDVWAVGWFTNGFSLHEIPLTLHWDGTAWSQVAAPDASPPSEDFGTELTSVSANSPSDAWAVGSAVDGASTVTMHWDGHNWTLIPSPDPGGDPGVTFSNLLDGVAAQSASSVWAVGRYNVALGNGIIAQHSLVLHWDGHTWTQVHTQDPGETENELFGVAAGPGPVVWAAGLWRNDGLPLSPHRPLTAVFGVVPNVVGQPQAAAIDAMNTAGLNTTITKIGATQGCHFGLKGIVMSTSPAAGAIASSPVNLNVCNIPATV